MTIQRKLEMLLIFVTTFSNVVGQSGGTGKKSTVAEWQEVRTRTDRILKELKEPGLPDWAGKYENGDIGFVGEILYVAPKSGFVSRHYSDTGEYADLFDFGSVELKDGRIFLKPVRGNIEEQEYFFVKWGERQLFIPAKRMFALLTQANAGCEQFDSTRTLTLVLPTRANTLDKRVSGIPEISDPFRSFLITTPITVALTEVGDSKTVRENNLSQIRTTKVTLDHGKADGLWRGMRLYWFEKTVSDKLLQATVKEVSDHSAAAEVEMAFENKIPSMPQKGWRFTTRLNALWFKDLPFPPDVCW